jgi:3-phosphoshikimate 1-carboxyvinyltransferase
MILTVKPSQLSGTVPTPGSKSHTIRGVVIASLAEGTSVLRSPLTSADAEAAVRVCRGLGAEIAYPLRPQTVASPSLNREGEYNHDNPTGGEWRIKGVGGSIRVPDDVLDVGNSGTTLYVAAAAAALADGYSVFTGDEQIRRRPVEALLGALRGLGAEAFTTRGNGCAPFVIRGPLRGGKIAIKCPTSQYLTALLLACPLAQGDSQIEVLELTEHPYVEMTLHWLNRQGICYERDGFDRFTIPGGQSYTCFDEAIPADWSSATFFLCAGAIGKGELRLAGLDMTDPQGDKAVVEMLRKMGAEIAEVGGAITVRGGKLHGAKLDLNATPDALPALAVTACFAEGETRLVNVAQARLKETDRIAVMAAELRKMGATVEERQDGLVIQGSPLRGTTVHGHGDHRVVMSLAVAGTFAQGTTVIDTAEAMAVTFPNFADLMSSLGGDIELTQ